MWTRLRLTITVECILERHLGAERGWYVGSGNLTSLISCFHSIKNKRANFWLAHELWGSHSCFLGVWAANRKADRLKRSGVCIQTNSANNNPKVSQPLRIFPNYVYIVWTWEGSTGSWVRSVSQFLPFDPCKAWTQVHQDVQWRMLDCISQAVPREVRSG